MQIHLPDIKAFAVAASDHNLVALGAALPFDHETAVTLADRFVEEESLFLLESATSGPGNVARYSFLGFDPLWKFSWQIGGETAAFETSAPNPTIEQVSLPNGNPLLGLRHVMQRFRLQTLFADDIRIAGPDVGRFVGPVGFMGYDMATALEPTIGTPPIKKLGLPDCLFFVPRNFFVLDHLSRRLFVMRLVSTEVGDIEAMYHQEARALRATLKRLSAVHSPPPLVIEPGEPDFDQATPSFAKEEFLPAVAYCLEQIRSGEIFQVQIGNRLSVETHARPFDMFRHLRTLNPSPYMFYFKFGEDHVLGASPEMMVNVAGRRMTHRPIAGTRKRSWDTERDIARKIELTQDEKERAEHVMLVDLSRNDIGRIAAAGSVSVEELMMVEEYSHVFHMVSQVSGDLGEGMDEFDAMVASFPNGTVSGAPKIRAMQMINQLEPVSREFYAGSLGLFDFDGNLKSTILIRSLHVRDGIASTQASAGIVYDSVAEQEWQETRSKMRACLTVMQKTR